MSSSYGVSDDGVKRGGRHAIIDAGEEEKMRAAGMPVRCCDYWPECSHMLAFVEARAADAATTSTERETAE